MVGDPSSPPSLFARRAAPPRAKRDPAPIRGTQPEAPRAKRGSRWAPQLGQLQFVLGGRKDASTRSRLRNRGGPVLAPIVIRAKSGPAPREARPSTHSRHSARSTPREARPPVLAPIAIPREARPSTHSRHSARSTPREARPGASRATPCACGCVPPRAPARQCPTPSSQRPAATTDQVQYPSGRCRVR